MSSLFYLRPEWIRLRYRVLQKYGRKCMCCGAHDGVGAIIQVDHIRPIAKYPELALDESNLQVLCRDCNLGKSYKYEDDFRPKDAKLYRYEDEKEFRKIIKTLRGELAKAEQDGDLTRHEKLLKIYTETQRELRSGKTEAALTTAIRSICDAEIGPRELA